MKRVLLLTFLLLAGMSVSFGQSNVNLGRARFRLVTLDPGHFHAALVQKFMYADVDPLVHVYAPAGDDLREHLKRIELFNTRSNEPTSWRARVYSGPDFLERIARGEAGKYCAVIAGNNLRKTDYILKCVQAGLNVLADKPMAITPEDFETLQRR